MGSQTGLRVGVSWVVAVPPPRHWDGTRGQDFKSSQAVHGLAKCESHCWHTPWLTASLLLEVAFFRLCCWWLPPPLQKITVVCCEEVHFSHSPGLLPPVSSSSGPCKLWILFPSLHRVLCRISYQLSILYLTLFSLLGLPQCPMDI